MVRKRVVYGETQAVPHAAHADYYAEIVREKFIVREVIYAGTDILKAGYEPGAEADELLDFASSRFQRLSETNSRPAESAVSDLLADVQRSIEAGEEPGIPTGFVDVDEILIGLRPGTLTILAARPSVGKTSFAGNVAMNVAKRDGGVLFFSLEQGKLELAERFLVSESGIDSHKIRAGDLNDFDR